MESESSFAAWLSMEHQTVPEDDKGDDKHTFLYRKEKRLTTAITVTHLLAYLRGESIRGYREFFDEFGVRYDPMVLDNCRNYQSWLFKKFKQSKFKIDLRLSGMKATIERVYDLQYAFWTKRRPGYILHWWDDSFLRKILSFREALNRIITELGASRERRKSYYSRQLNCLFTAYEDMIVVTEDRQPTLVIPWLALVSCYTSFVSLSDLLIFHMSDPERCDHENIEDLKELIEGIMTDFITHGSKFYKAIKDWHPAVLSIVLRGDFDLVNGLEAATLQKMPESYLKTRLLSLEDKQCHREIDLAGSSKCYTIPIIDISASVAVTLEATLPRKNLGPDQDALCFIKMCITKEYYKQHNTWPPITGGSAKIRAHQRENSWPGGRDKFKLSDFKTADIGQILEFDYKIDTSELLRDKACCGGRSKWSAEFDRRYYKAKYKQNLRKSEPSQKRVILEYLNREEVDCRDIIYNFLRNRPLEMLIIILCWKEGELSELKARGFTKLVFDPRVYQISCESNMKSLMRYFPYQKLTKGGDALTKLLMNVSKTGYLRTSIDFKSWCNHWCDDVLTDYLHFLDGVFGLKGVYSELHKIAEQMLVIFSDRANIPKATLDGTPELGHRAFTGFKSLGQGMAQSVWTVFSAASILAKFYKMGLEAHIMAAGDNQVILVKETPQLSGRCLQRIVERIIRRSAKQTGHETKPEETFTSRVVTEFNKQTFIHGKKASQGSKKAAKIGGEAAALL